MDKKRFSLKFVINSIILLVTFIAFVTNGIAVYYTWNNMLDIRKQNVNTISYQLSNYLTAENERLGRIQRNLIGQVRENDFFLLGDGHAEDNARKSMSEYVYSMQEVNNNPIYAIAVDRDNEIRVITETLISGELAAIKNVVEDYADMEFDNMNTKLHYEYFMIKEPEFMRMIYVCCYAPIYDYDFSVGKTYHIGNMLVCTKINIEKLLMEYEEWSNIDLRLEKEGYVLDVMMAQNMEGNSGVELNSISIKNTDWQINGVIYETKLEKNLSDLIILMVFGVLCVILLMLLFHKMLNRIINKPISSIVDYLNRRVDGNEKHRLEIKESPEFNLIAESINNMIEADYEKTKCIFMQQQRLYEYDLQTKEALLNNLQKQINPHFLYNTLECIRTLALVKNANDVADIAVDIADIMRYSLSIERDVLIKDEVRMLKHYLSIMSARYPERFQCNIDIPEEIMVCKTMKMILQPVLENSFKHGLKMTKSGNRIDIRAEQIDGDIYLSIRDNGKGITEDELEKLKSKLHNEYSEQEEEIGILNVHHRLKLFYGEPYGIDIESKHNEFTTVTLKIPKTPSLIS